MNAKLTMHDLNAAITFAIQFLGPEAFTENPDGTITWSDEAVELGRTYFASLEVEP